MPIDLSIIIPCYNRVKLLKETLKSVESAISRIKVEIILVDDGSMPAISEQIQEFNHLPLSVIRQPNSGLTTSRYNGLLAAKGEYIQFLDSDDQVAANKFELQLERMRATGADISHTDIQEYLYNTETGEYEFKTTRKTRHSEDPAEFFIRVQPTPHSPIFRREYLVDKIKNAFIPLCRDYDAIGEIWFYYNLSIYPAKVIKVEAPLTIIVHHDNGRLTDNWEIMGLCALALQYQFAKHLSPSPAHHEARRRVANAAFHTFRRLPYNMSRQFQEAFLDVWQKLGRTTVKELNLGFYFSVLAYLAGPVNAAKLYKRIKAKNYDNMRSITDDDLDQRLSVMLNRLEK